MKVTLRTGNTECDTLLSSSSSSSSRRRRSRRKPIDALLRV